MVSLNTDSSHPVYRALDYKEAEQLLSVITRVLSDRKPKNKVEENPPARGCAAG
ncbi:hypothetical protein I7S93_28305 (plasmid) [Klebsiella pneumoniae]|uniref:hypothetical protein n=1 Tax=Klebsiella pneumoniae TaxID=573 RepID=UPI0019375B16|nr:hypothetical protein [Klebsiella pneumoniae]QPQ49681.1 hypothetical protein I7S93_28305 [Klebsiella pneumoniae]